MRIYILPEAKNHLAFDAAKKLHLSQHMERDMIVAENDIRRSGEAIECNETELVSGKRYAMFEYSPMAYNTWKEPRKDGKPNFGDVYTVIWTYDLLNDGKLSSVTSYGVFTSKPVQDGMLLIEV